MRDPLRLTLRAHGQQENGPAPELTPEREGSLRALVARASALDRSGEAADSARLQQMALDLLDWAIPSLLNALAAERDAHTATTSKIAMLVDQVFTVQRSVLASLRDIQREAGYIQKTELRYCPSCGHARESHGLAGCFTKSFGRVCSCITPDGIALA